jgi:hypothetical protein
MKNEQPKYHTKPTLVESSQNPYHPVRNREINPEYNLGVANDDIYRSASKKKYLSSYELQ